MDAAKLIENFTAFANGKGWPTEHLDAALSVYSQVRDEGPGAATEPVSAEADAATIAKATELMRTDPNAYWRNAELQEALFESLERQETDKSVPVETPPATAADAALAPDGGARAASPGRVVDPAPTRRNRSPARGSTKRLLEGPASRGHAAGIPKHPRGRTGAPGLTDRRDRPNSRGGRAAGRRASASSAERSEARILNMKASSGAPSGRDRLDRRRRTREGDEFETRMHDSSHYHA